MSAPTVFISGANRGIGLELVRQYAHDGAKIYAGCRNIADADALQALAEQFTGLIILTLDVTSTESIAAAVSQLQGAPVDVLINNAGTIGRLNYDTEDRAERIAPQMFGTLDYEAWRDAVEVNGFGPMRLAEALFENVKQSVQKKLVFISSTVGSISDSMVPVLAYPSSKTLLNKAVKLATPVWTSNGVAAVLICPGHVKTRLGGIDATLEPEESVKGIRKIITETDIDRTGRFLRYNGEAIGW